MASIRTSKTADMERRRSQAIGEYLRGEASRYQETDGQPGTMTNPRKPQPDDEAKGRPAIGWTMERCEAAANVGREGLAREQAAESPQHLAELKADTQRELARVLRETE